MTFNLLDFNRVISALRRRLLLLEIQVNQGAIKTGLAANRPTTIILSKGMTVSYYATDTKVLSVWNIENEAWDTITLT